MHVYAAAAQRVSAPLAETSGGIFMRCSSNLNRWQCVCVCLIFSELIFLVLYLHLSHKGVCVYVCAKYSLSEYNALL